MLYEDGWMSDEIKRTPDDDERVSRLSGIGSRPKDAGDDIVQEYENRYTPTRKVTPTPRSYSTMKVSDDERLWAAIAHGSIWITLLGGLFTGGFVVPLSIFIPLVVYFLYRKQSDYIAFHALQAFVLQLIATVGVMTVAVIGGTAWAIGMVIAALAVVVLAGIVLVPLWGIVGIALALIIFVTPFAALLFGTIATVQTYNRHDYRYPLIAQWVDRQLAGGLLTTL
jgi:uncharacterized Tic20 family protein